MKKVVLVNKKDEVVGLENKVKAHLGQGILHRAFTILVFNKKGEVLLQKRAKEKMLWPLVWETTCSSHPLENETHKEAGEKRLKQELGFSCPLKLIDKFVYRSVYKNGSTGSPRVIGAENEVCGLLKGEYNEGVKADPKETAEWKWVGLSELREDIKNNPEQYAPWLKIALQKITKINKSLKK